MGDRKCFYCGKILPGDELCPDCIIPCSGGVHNPCTNRADTALCPWGTFAHCPSCEAEWNKSLDEYMDDFVANTRKNED